MRTSLLALALTVASASVASSARAQRHSLDDAGPGHRVGRRRPRVAARVRRGRVKLDPLSAAARELEHGPARRPRGAAGRHEDKAGASPPSGWSGSRRTRTWTRSSARSPSRASRSSAPASRPLPTARTRGDGRSGGTSRVEDGRARPAAGQRRRSATRKAVRAPASATTCRRSSSAGAVAARADRRRAGRSSAPERPLPGHQHPRARPREETPRTFTSRRHALAPGALARRALVAGSGRARGRRRRQGLAGHRQPRGPPRRGRRARAAPRRGRGAEDLRQLEARGAVETNGEPSLVPMQGTSLLWAKNTDADLFVDTSSNMTYLLITGRWFRAPSRLGPWTAGALERAPGRLFPDPRGRPCRRGPGVGARHAPGAGVPHRQRRPADRRRRSHASEAGRHLRRRSSSSSRSRGPASVTRSTRRRRSSSSATGTTPARTGSGSRAPAPTVPGPSRPSCPPRSIRYPRAARSITRRS